MATLKKRVPIENKTVNGLYIHSNPPRVLQLSSAYLKQLIKSGDVEKLEQAVINGQGRKLLGENSGDPKTRNFLKNVPSLMSKISLLHDAVNSGKLDELKSLLDEEPDKKKKLVLCKDEAGVGLLHKAVYHDLKNIYKYLINTNPNIVSMKDSEGRTAYHYTPMCKDPSAVQKLLRNAGAEPAVVDNFQHSVKYYMDHKQELELPSGQKSTAAPRKSAAMKEGLNFKKSNIRIWIHQRNTANLQQVIWEGQGGLLLVEHSNNPKMKKFLEAVPHIMGLIKDIHTDVINGDLESLKDHVNSPIPPVLLYAKDTNGLTPLHKAVGLDKEDIAKFILEHYPTSINATDNERRTPLHYAALLKDDGKMMRFLLENGADESALDNKQKTAAYYKTRTSEIDSKLLSVIPDCPRSAKESFANFDWSMLSSIPALNGLQNGLKKMEKHINSTVETTSSKIEQVSSSEPKSSKEENDIPEKKEPTSGKSKTANKMERNNNNELEDNRETESSNQTRSGSREESRSRPLSKHPSKNNVVEGSTENQPPSQSRSESRGDSQSRPISKERSKSSQSDENNEEETVVQSRSESRGDVKSRANSEPDVKSRSESRHSEKSRPTSEAGKSRPISQNEEHSRSESKIDSTTRPNSKMVEFADQPDLPDKEDLENKTLTRPNSESDRPKSEMKSRPTSESKSNTRPNSQVSKETLKSGNSSKANTRPNSKMVEGVDTSNPNSRPGTRPGTRPVSQSENKSNPIVDGERVIEGVIDGENEVESMNNEGINAPRSNSNEDITSLVASGNMEQMAALVLNGEGQKLLGQKSDNSELQSFLENVPVYMSKINRIHKAARDGSLKDLQAALDRRKFAIAKDPISPNGASPLHVAVVFGNTSIVRYLAGRFPETAQVADDNGRTPLHYAAVLKDNGHYYNLLVHLGADTRVEDNFHHTPEYYRRNQTEFSHNMLLKQFGEEIDEDAILADKVPNDTITSRKDLDDQDMITILQRCLEVIQGRRESLSTNSSAVTTTSMKSKCSLLSKHLKKYIFDQIYLRVTKLDHNLYDVIWPSVKKLPNDLSFRVALEQDFPLGIVIPDFYAYKVFQELLYPIIKDYNNKDIHQELSYHPPSDFLENSKNAKINTDLDLDPQSKWIITDNTEREDGHIDMPFFATEEGRYLASSLGDPLIKGLTEVANKRPEDPIAYLAQYLYNFANNRNNLKSRGKAQETQQIIQGSPTNNDNNEAVPASIDVVTVEPDESEAEESAFNETTRDEHGQSMLHFAAARTHGRNSLFQIMVETEINIALRDELYRTARDISIQANIPDNTDEIDRYVMHIATKGDTDKLVELLLEGYDHITDIVDDDETPIIEAVSKANQNDTVSFLQSILAFEEKRERVHHAIRQGNFSEVKNLLADENETGSGKLLAIGKNNYGRCSLHIAVLCQQEEIVDYLANTFPDTLRLGDNIERTALHYAMGVEKMETISKVLIKAGAKRVAKDLKGRQPTYYFLNKSDILRLQEEEETF